MMYQYTVKHTVQRSVQPDTVECGTTMLHSNMLCSVVLTNMILYNMLCSVGESGAPPILPITFPEMAASINPYSYDHDVEENHNGDKNCDPIFCLKVASISFDSSPTFVSLRRSCHSTNGQTMTEADLYQQLFKPTTNPLLDASFAGHAKPRIGHFALGTC